MTTETVIERTNRNLFEFASPIMLDGKAIAGVQYGLSTRGLDGLMASIIAQRLLQTGLLVVVVPAFLYLSRFMRFY